MDYPAKVRHGLNLNFPQSSRKFVSRTSFWPAKHGTAKILDPAPDLNSNSQEKLENL